MSAWIEFKSDAGKIASKAAVKAGELTDTASAKIKIQGIKLRLCEEYEKLGRLTYKAHKNGVDNSAATAEVMAKIDRMYARIKKTENDMKIRREERRSKAEEKSESCEPESTEPDDCDTD